MVEGVGEGIDECEFEYSATATGRGGCIDRVVASLYRDSERRQELGRRTTTTTTGYCCRTKERRRSGKRVSFKNDLSPTHTRSTGECTGGGAQPEQWGPGISELRQRSTAAAAAAKGCVVPFDK